MTTSLPQPQQTPEQLKWQSDLEDTKIVSIDTTNRDKVEDVAQLYKEMFNQDAVGLYITPSMEFI